MCRPGLSQPPSLVRFIFTYAATTEIYTLSLHDALPISSDATRGVPAAGSAGVRVRRDRRGARDDARRRPRSLRTRTDRKSTRLNSSHSSISYAVFCLKKKKPDERAKLQGGRTHLPAVRP